MKRIFTLLLCGIAAAIYAQPTITSSISPVLGDVTHFKMINAPAFDVGPSGADVTWDFSVIPIGGIDYTNTYVTPDATGHGADYPGANLATEDATGTFSYFETSASVFSFYGIYDPSPTTKINYDDPMEIFTFPLTYNTTNADDLYAEFYSGSDVVRSGSITMIADGYGTLKVPSGTYTDVLRVKEIEDYADNVAGLPYPIEYYFTRYYWLKAGVKGPLFQYFDDITTINGTPSVSDNILLNTDAGVIGIHNDEVELNVQISPNPATENIQITTATAESIAHVSIHDITGKLMLESDFSNTASTLSLIDFTPGLYSITVERAGLQSVKMIVIE